MCWELCKQVGFVYKPEQGNCRRNKKGKKKKTRYRGISTSRHTTSSKFICPKCNKGKENPPRAGLRLRQRISRNKAKKNYVNIFQEDDKNARNDGYGKACNKLITWNSAANTRIETR